MTDPAPAAAVARLLLVDDHAIVRQGLAALLSRDPGLKVAGEAGSYDEALDALERLAPDCVVLDLSLGDRSGLDWITEVRARGYAGKIVVLSMHDETLYAPKARERGADGYVMKDHAEDALLRSIWTALGVDSAAAARPAPAAGGDDAGEAALTAREREILYAIGSGLTTRDIAARLGLSARTVDVHRLNIKRKLACATFADVLARAMAFKQLQDRRG